MSRDKWGFLPGVRLANASAMLVGLRGILCGVVLALVAGCGSVGTGAVEPGGDAGAGAATTEPSDSSEAGAAGAARVVGPPSSCGKPGQPVTVTSSSDPVLGITLDATHAYWTTGRRIADAAPSGGTVMRVALAGGAPETLVSDQPLPTDIAVDSHNIYWIDAFSRQVMTAPLTGGEPSTFATTGQPSALTVDASNAYWLSFDYTTLTSAVMKAPLAGGAAIQLAPAGLHTGGLAVNASDVYWIDLDPDSVPQSTAHLMQAPLDGGPATTLFSTAGGVRGMAVDEHSAYLVVDDSVLKFPLAGGTPASVASGIVEPSIAVGTTDVFITYSNGGSESLLKAPLAGGKPEPVAANLRSLAQLAAHGSEVCWATNDTPSTVMCLDTCD
jgi:hypothetical protein